MHEFVGMVAMFIYDNAAELKITSAQQLIDLVILVSHDELYMYFQFGSFVFRFLDVPYLLPLKFIWRNLHYCYKFGFNTFINIVYICI